MGNMFAIKCLFGTTGSLTNLVTCLYFFAIADLPGIASRKSTPVMRRIPITPKPTTSTQASKSTTHFTTKTTTKSAVSPGHFQPKVATKVQLNTKKLLAAGSKEVNKITSKFLSSSMASTNIMDTSDLPVTLVTSSEVTTSIGTTTKSTTTTTMTTTKVITSTTRKTSTVYAAPSLHLESNKAYPIIPTPSTKEARKNDLKCPQIMRGGLQWNWTLAGNILQLIFLIE